MTADAALDGPSGPKPTGMDTAILPLGERSLRLILEHVLAVGDEAETTYLEVKSTLDFTTKAGGAKVAKFLLGAANRRPREAVSHFRGHAVMIIGAKKGAAPGVPRGVEAHELEDRLRPYLGPQFPAFEFGRIGVDDANEVLFVIAQPPQDGQPIFPCHKSFQGDDRRDSLEDGAVYVRGTSNTRPARAGEVLALVERARGGGKPPICLEVAILGPIARVSRVDEVMDRLYQIEEEKFDTTPEPLQNKSLLTIAAPSFFGSPEPKSASEREARLDMWRSEKVTNIAIGREYFLGAALSGLGLRIISRERFVAKPHLIVTFHDCEALEFRNAEEANFEKVVEPIVRRPSRYVLGPDPSDHRFTPRDYPVDWANKGDDVEVLLTPESFRPNMPWSSNQDDYVILARNPRSSSVTVTWVLTEDGNDDVTRGELQVPAAALLNAAELFKATFL
ncbi:hypothetical protein MB46_18680 [Arthrobacter alpinus]|uniref:hypothetical protein n=1 Tax=Arthrobacter alpinus TaxID=656366 RepID=UPI0005C8A5ED|nr:hypothetical protein [Arthrobacter alpinus]ALV47218.1 hypothetical protein MB46_18680 [Arthrobacter alpinus]